MVTYICKMINMMLELICYSLQQIAMLVLQEYNKELKTLGMSQEIADLCDLYISPEGEQKTFIENFNCFQRFLLEFTSEAVNYYCQLNEFFERKPLPDQQVQLIFQHLLIARFKIIEVIGLLQTDTIIRVKEERTEEIKQEQKETEEVIKNEMNFFKRRESILKLRSLQQSQERMNKLKVDDANKAINESNLNLLASAAAGNINETELPSPVLNKEKSQKILEKLRQRVKQENQIMQLNIKLLGSPKKRHDSQFLRRMIKQVEQEEHDYSGDRNLEQSKYQFKGSHKNTQGQDNIKEIISDMKRNGAVEIQKALNYSHSIKQLHSKNHYGLDSLPKNQGIGISQEKSLRGAPSESNLTLKKIHYVNEYSATGKPQKHSNSNNISINNQLNENNKRQKSHRENLNYKFTNESKMLDNSKLKNFLKNYEKSYEDQEKRRKKQEVYSDDDEKVEFMTLKVKKLSRNKL
ncbi:UNKNOWN [Stylonychia lemnae]|uniref:Uncharacterized protein n=1 Tax=Stylonychia lemnae TaxID=5949 RepID=A0A078AS99_STYLE|nr:UNKNOWN [Stylonychia lemnae]|eukprot:CDW85340.1 UNKNOWN [Stylonychia lemnae]